MFRLRFLFAVLVAGVVSSPRLGAQTVHGFVVDPSGRPVSGVVAALLDGNSAVVARSLTTQAGEFRLLAPADGAYRVRTMRIGFRPTVSAPLRLVAGTDVTHRIVLDAIAVALDTIRVENKNVCRRIAADSTALVFAVWEQARTAITAAQLTAVGRGIASTTIAYERSLEPKRDRIKAQTADVRTEYVREPWRELSPDSLRRLGYVVSGADGYTTFYAPGFSTLLSPGFVEDHCFRIGKSTEKNRLILEFEPTPERDKFTEIRGSLFFDRSTAELQRLEFRYANVPAFQADNAGGAMEFVRMRNGGWVISRWSIRMPVLERIARSKVTMQKFGDAETRIGEIQVAGGAVTSVVAGRDTVWSHPLVTLTGVVVDSTSGAPVANARVALSGTKLSAVANERGKFEIPNVLPGEYTAEVRTPALDSLNAEHLAALIVGDSAAPVEIRAPSPKQVETLLCGEKRMTLPGIVSGMVTVPMGDSIPRNATVIAEWSTLGFRAGGTEATIAREKHVLEARVSADGSFRLCGVPVSTAMIISAIADSAESPSPANLTIAPNTRFARTSLQMMRVAAGRSVFSGTVISDDTQRPQFGASVLLPDLGKAFRTEEMGVFRISDIPAGDHRIIIRHFGYAPLDTTFTFGSGRLVAKRIALQKVLTLDSVRVIATAFDKAMRSFEDHRKTGLGAFVNRAELAKLETLPMDATIQNLRGIRLVRGRSSQVWVVSSRGPQSLAGTALRDGDDWDKRSGAKLDCYAHVYIDGRPVYSGRDGEPLFDVNGIRPDELEAVEYYAGPAETPLEYSNIDTTCGVLAMWTRR